MDPNATLRMLMEGCLDQDRDTAAEAARNLADWLDKGGFLPQVTRYQDGERNRAYQIDPS